MTGSQRTRSVVVELDGIAGIGDLEEAALTFARTRRASWSRRRWGWSAS